MTDLHMQLRRYCFFVDNLCMSVVCVGPGTEGISSIRCHAGYCTRRLNPPSFLCLFCVVLSCSLLLHVWFCYARFNFFSDMLSDWMRRTSPKLPIFCVECDVQISTQSIYHDICLYVCVSVSEFDCLYVCPSVCAVHSAYLFTSAHCVVLLFLMLIFSSMRIL